MKHVLAALFLGPLVLAGCVVTPVDPADPVDLCGASDLQYLVGQPGRVLDGMRFSQDLRVIQPGMAVTMDYRPDRLNITINDFDQIERVYCS